MQRIPILTYHQIDHPPKKGAPYRSLYVSPTAFARQMHVLRLLGYQGLSMGKLLPYLKGEKQGKVIGITFDDGYLNNLTYAMPVLQMLGFSATCYVVSGQIGKTNSWDLSLGIAQTALMSVQELLLWTHGGQEVGAHTRSHARLVDLDASQSQNEIAGSKADLEALLGVPVSNFCYPYGDYGAQHVSQVLHAGFETATTTKRARAVVGSHFLELSRVPIVRSTTLPVFLLKLFSTYEDRK